MFSRTKYEGTALASTHITHHTHNKQTLRSHHFSNLLQGTSELWSKLINWQHVYCQGST